MKARFKNMLLGYTGTCDGLVYYFNRRLNRVIVRLHVKPRTSENNRRFGRIATNLKRLNLSAGFRQDLRIYTDLFNSHTANQDITLQSWYNAFSKLMWNLAKLYPGLDLEFVTRAQIEAGDLPCRSVKRAVEAGLLPPVNGSELLDKLM
ncbi:MAG: hypothetical protein PHD87_00470 [Candidatus Cloacimonetes bacterium]|nr:hypothetical protein [Candidatus Cloacimonadota bacterium]